MTQLQRFFNKQAQLPLQLFNKINDDVDHNEMRNKKGVQIFLGDLVGN